MCVCVCVCVCACVFDVIFHTYSYVIDPYNDYPNLMDILFNFLKSEQTQGIRREVSVYIRFLISTCIVQVIRVLGLLGALDPHKHRVQKGRTQRSNMGMPISKPMDKSSKQTGGIVNLSQNFNPSLFLSHS